MDEWQTLKLQWWFVGQYCNMVTYSFAHISCPQLYHQSRQGNSNQKATHHNAPGGQYKWVPFDELWHNHTCLLLLISMLWHRQAIFESKGDKLSCSAECRIRTHQGLRHQIASRLNARWQTDWAIEDQAKTWTRQLVKENRNRKGDSLLTRFRPQAFTSNVS